ncbi:MAG: hypothetical protein KKF48_02410 [Nanoarchaeota archaeon]|nr:hypothetical protein [Nanoarchaeota archaeon]MBU1027873.1 hypothetical protein [Nanoarchaeota archaeon]
MPKIHLTKDYKRQRVSNPKNFDPKSLRTIQVSGRKDVKLIVGCEKGKFKKGKCSVGTKLQAILHKRQNGKRI